ncbi:MAG TPA: RNA methyltransferase [Bacteroidota bacterium]|nr:RNA methyltransferase [Bacteroidota bacterium]
MKIIPIQSLDHPDLQPYRTLRRPLDHERQGLFVGEGEKVVRRLLESPLLIFSLLMTHEWYEQLKGVLSSRSDQPTLFLAEKRLVESIVGFHVHQGIMAVAKIPQPFELNDVLEKANRPYLIAAVDGLTNSENVGVLVRNCVAFGVQALLVGETSSSPYLRRAVRNSMGTVFRLPVVRAKNLAAELRLTRKEFGIRSFAAHPKPGSVPISNADLTKDCCLVFGSEGEGISEAVVQACDEAVMIPMQRGVDSLNVASASAVALYEVRRQRKIL